MAYADKKKPKADSSICPQCGRPIQQLNHTEHVSSLEMDMPDWTELYCGCRGQLTCFYCGDHRLRWICNQKTWVVGRGGNCWAWA